MRHHILPRNRKPRRGATTVEFALVVPIFILTILFFFETWRFQQIQQVVDHAALEAARVAIVPGATAEAARAKAGQLLAATGADSAEITVAPETLLASTDEVTVTVEVPYSDVGLIYQYFAPSHIFSSTLTLATENSRIGRL
jgi:Flp pilus assembly protein TadG